MFNFWSITNIKYDFLPNMTFYPVLHILASEQEGPVYVNPPLNQNQKLIHL